jgi:hypothetical protein
MDESPNAPRDEQGVARAVREKFKRFYGDLTDEERGYAEARIKETISSAAERAGIQPLITAPNIGLVINNSSKALVVTQLDTTDRPIGDVFDGTTPKVGDVIAPGQIYSFNWVEWFSGSGCDTYLKAQDGSGTIRTGVSMSIYGGWTYQCEQPSGSLAPETPQYWWHWNWNRNVAVIDS